MTSISHSSKFQKSNYILSNQNCTDSRCNCASSTDSYKGTITFASSIFNTVYCPNMLLVFFTADKHFSPLVQDLFPHLLLLALIPLVCMNNFGINLELCTLKDICHFGIHSLNHRNSFEAVYSAFLFISL